MAFSLLLLAGSSAALAAARETARPVKWIRGIYVAETPASRGVPASILLPQAETRAAALKGAALRGYGRSMQPLYQPGTVLVVAPAPFEQLRRGQTVVYHNREGRQVAHVLIAKCKDGWRVAGLNNRVHDDEGVTPANLFGIVVEAYHAEAGAAPLLAAVVK